MQYTLSPLGDQAVVIEVGKQIDTSSEQKVKAVVSRLEAEAPPWMIEYIPAYTTVTVLYSIREFLKEDSPYKAVCERIRELLEDVKESAATQQKVVKIPVLYGGEFGPDLDFVAKYNGLTADEVIEIHTSGDYKVHMIGFAPGFPFIGGMSEKIGAPRRTTPRLKIPARSVGIAGVQTGVYPIETPGGWQLIGRTPLELFLPDEDPPSLLAAGDIIQFYEITRDEYEDLRGGAE
ncbi:5-oxoprolinase subunit PxpB [Sporosarcina sp. ACRSL]|uniref:5-oxoprolinase subunit PxpB n=1 Tax=Sporosarcina sp. ACRSL TaxID=2918215 RepID=UPI001EF46543|nr:5-oxoprolinase subunit PxpB [Sporosarcina sp. ACRSL]MCG7343165.1 5-oxoprolinase subunit PxpB [Sporosarcina sp. ACRSL]